MTLPDHVYSTKRLPGIAGTFIGAVVFFCLTIFAIAVVWFKTVHSAEASKIDFPYQFGDFLINYSAGFVRRGAAGALLRYLSHGHSVLMGVSVYVFVTFVLLVLSLTFLVLVRAKRRVETLLLVALMPGGYLIMSITGEFMFRKEFGFLAALGVFACGYVVLGKISGAKLRAVCSRFAIIFVFAVSLFDVLTHGAFVFLVAPAFGYFLLGFARYAGVRRPQRVAWLYVLSMFLLFVVLVVFFHGTAAQVAHIWQHADPVDKAQFGPGRFGSLGTLALSVSWERNLAIAIALSGYTWWYIGPIAFTTLYCMATVCLNEEETPDSTSWMRCFLVIFAATLPMFVLGCDWGRWIVTVELSFLIVWFAMGSETLASMDLLKGLQCEYLLESIESLIRRIVRKRPVAVFWLLLAFTLTFKLPELFVSLELQDNGPYGFIWVPMYRGIHLIHHGHP